MKNKIFKQIISVLIISSVCFAFAFGLKPQAMAWSTYTHAALSAEALSKFSSLMPQAVFSSSLPDITTNFISPASKDEFYSIFHGDNFYRAASRLLSKLDKGRDKNMICNIYGYLSHLAADETAHAPTGYANSKKTFRVKTELDHYVAYLFMDMLCYYDYFYGYNSRFGKFVPDVDSSLVKAALDEYNLEAPKKAAFDKAVFAKKETLFKAGIAVQKAIFDIIIDENPELFEQARSFYSDCYMGVNCTGGFYDTAASVEEKISAGAGVDISENAFKSFVNKQISDITYIGMQFASVIARDTDFIRTSKLTSGKIENFVSKFFESRSKSTQSMGKFLSALLLKKGLTYEEIIDYTDGGSAVSQSPTEKEKKYKSAYKKLKEPRWYSFIPGSDSGEKREYIDAFIEYQKEKNESEIKAAAIGAAPAEIIRNAVEKRLSAYREAYLASKLNPVKYIAKQAAKDAAYIDESVVKSYIAARCAAAARKDAALCAALDSKMADFKARAARRIKSYSEKTFGRKISSPLKSLYEKEYALAASADPAGIAKAVDFFKRAVKDPGAYGLTAGFAEAPPDAGLKITRIGSGGDAPDPAEARTLNQAMALMTKAYKDYADYLAGCDLNDERARAQLDARLKKYTFYKKAYEKLFDEAQNSPRD